jgi:hypothetical protein
MVEAGGKTAEAARELTGTTGAAAEIAEIA